jgi:hypothetical protein
MAVSGGRGWGLAKVCTFCRNVSAEILKQLGIFCPCEKVICGTISANSRDNIKKTKGNGKWRPAEGSEYD